MKKIFKFWLTFRYELNNIDPPLLKNRLREEVNIVAGPKAKVTG